MRKILVVDIETKQFHNASDALEPFLDNIKTRSKLDPVKVAAEKAQKRENMLSKAALTPLASEVIAIGLGFVELYDDDDMFMDDKEVGSVLKDVKVLINEGNEAELLMQFKEIADQYSEFVTFNGRNFDFPYLMFRAAIYGIKIKLPTYYKNTGDGHFDLAQHLVRMSLIENIDSSIWYVSLAKWMRYFGIEMEKELDGPEEIADAYTNNRALFIQYTANDIRRTFELFKRFEDHFERRFR